MTMQRVWFVQCDELFCGSTIRFPSHWLREDAGESLNDAGWTAGPGFPQTYCPAHARDGEELAFNAALTDAPD